MGRIKVIVNPIAGRGLAGRLLPKLRQQLAAHTLDCDLVCTEEPGHGAVLAEQALSEGFETIVAVGGDGTLGEVATGLAGSDCILGALPTGTGNVWAHMLRLPHRTPTTRSTLMDAARVLVDGEVHRIDLGEAAGRYFVLWTGIGLDAQVARGVEPHREIRRNLGGLAYFVTLVALSLVLRGTRMTVVIDGKAVRQRVILILVANAQLYGPSVPIAPKAQLDDGLLDVCIFKGDRMLDVVRHIVMILSGQHLRDPKVETYRARRVEIRGEKSLPIHMDGDPVGQTPVTITVAPKALRVIVPRWASGSLFQEGAPSGEESLSLAQRIAQRLRYERERWREESERLRSDWGRRLHFPPDD